MKDCARELIRSAAATFLLAVLLCGLYPASVWLLGRAALSEKAGGSLIVSGERVLGTSLMSQDFPGPRYFHSRPSTAGRGYDASASGATNWGPLSANLLAAVERRVSEYRAENHLSRGAAVPADAVTASASGLDPHISVENARLQAGRVAAARGLTVQAVLATVERHTQGRTLGLLGRPRVNVLMLNLDLDGVLPR